MKKIKRVLLFALIVSFVASGQTAEQATQNCFDTIKIEPGFIAFTAKKNSKLGAWYQDTFGLEIVKEFSFPDGSVTGVLMKKNEFVVEIFYRDDALEGSDYVSDAHSEQWRGFMKFGMYTNANLKDLQQCLKNKGVKAGRIFHDKKLGIDLLQVIDIEGNTLEIISRF